MKVICDRGALVESLNLVGGVVASRTPKPALTCVKLSANREGDDGRHGETGEAGEAGGGDTGAGHDLAGLTLTATDLEVSVKLTTPRVEVEASGQALIPAGKLGQIVGESIDPTLTIETEQDTAQITGQDSKFKVFGQPVSDFPPTPEFTGEADFEIAASDLHRLIAQTLFATAKENSRYAINGVLIERDNNKLSVVATDGHRLALARGTCKAANSDEAKPAIVPTKALQLLLRLFDDAEQTVRVKIADDQILFAGDVSGGGAVLACTLVEGNFPPYRDVIPKDNDKKATLATDLFVSGVRRAALLTNEESKGVRMAFTDSGLKLSSRAPEMGEAEVNVEVPEYEGEPIEIGFNPAYLLDALKVIDDRQVEMDFKAPNKPGILRTGTDFLYVIMPVNLQ